MSSNSSLVCLIALMLVLISLTLAQYDYYEYEEYQDGDDGCYYQCYLTNTCYSDGTCQYACYHVCPQGGRKKRSISKHAAKKRAIQFTRQGKKQLID